MSFFRATDTGTILMGPGDVYTILASSAETDGDYIALEALVPLDGGPPPLTSTMIRPRLSLSLKGRWK